MKLPPLTALTYFNAAALNLSFKAAAKQFCVTEGAISRQIKLLEQYYGQPLFVRARRGVKLTDVGQRLILISGPAIQKIFQISEEIRGFSPQFTLSVTTSFAIRWLLPRLVNFEATHPNFPINIQAAKNPQEIQGIDYGASIIYVLGDPYQSGAIPPVNGHFIMAEWLIPVCSPALLDEGKSIPPSSMERFRLILNEPKGQDWRLWMKSIPTAKVQFDSAIRLEHDDTAIQAAVAGHGIALANVAYIDNELKMGSLVPIINHSPVAIGAHYFICEPSYFEQLDVKEFKDWLMKSATECMSQKKNTPKYD